MKKVYYYVVAFYSENPKIMSSQSSVAIGEEHLAAIINDLISQKLKKLKIHITRLAAKEIKEGGYNI